MSFIDSYKRLEKLCSEIYDDNHGVSSYIDEMISNPVGSRYVLGWDEDLKQLKHYRWVRNQIVHEPGCIEENMCKPEDTQWLINFHSRIMSARDPLALYRKARCPQATQEQKLTESMNYTYPQYKNTSSKPAGCLTYLMGVLLVVAASVLIVVTI
ncbi:MAG: hypothetical protein E7293_05905 [Lachnospiraceae bacterium]|nr:hypothetical protein [Lachnospiraceae bacterium]